MPENIIVAIEERLVDEEEESDEGDNEDDDLPRGRDRPLASRV